MENRTLSRALFGVSILLFLITAYFVYGMINNGNPKDLDYEQMGIELMDQGKATSSNYAEKGMEAKEKQVQKIEHNILGGVYYMRILLFIAGGLMVVFLIWGLINTLQTDFKKGIPSLIFVGISILAFVFAYATSRGVSVEGMDDLARKFGDKSKEVLTMSTFWVNGLLFVLVPGTIILLADLLIGIFKSYSK